MKKQLAIVLLCSFAILMSHLERTASNLISKGGENDVAEREIGTVKWFNSTKGFGFIARDQGGDIFVHYSGIRGEGYRSLEEGQQVEFTVIEAEKGPQAQDVIVLT